MQVIPAIDLLDGKAVRLRQGRYEEVTVYSDDPAALAREWRGQVERLHVVDLEGARSGHALQSDAVRAVAKAFGPGVQVGGGIRNRDSIRRYFELGVEKLILGTAAIHDRPLLEWAASAYPERIIVALDARAGRVATDGWLEQSDVLAIELVKSLSSLPLGAVLYTDVERDGTEVGPNVKETARLAKQGGLNVIASGGVGRLSDLSSLAQAHPNIVAAIVGRAIHERRFSLREAVEAATG